MENQLVFMGRLTDDPKVKDLGDGKQVSNITLEVPRSYKNTDREFDTDLVDVIISDKVAEATAKYSKKGAIVGIKGRVQTNTFETEAGEKRKSIQVVADKVTFFVSAKDKEANKEASDDYEM